MCCTYTYKKGFNSVEWNKRTKESPTQKLFASLHTRLPFYPSLFICPCCGWANEKYEITKWLIQRSQFMDASWKFNYYFFIPAFFVVADFFWWLPTQLFFNYASAAVWSLIWDFFDTVADATVVFHDRMNCFEPRSFGLGFWIFEWDSNTFLLK